MSKLRANWRAKQKEKHKEEMLSRQNAYGNNDPTPYEAVKQIRKEQYINEVKRNGAANNIN